MRNQIQLIVLLIASLIGLSATQNASASHFMTADIVYTQVAPATFNVQLNLVQDCNSGTAFPATAMVAVNSPGCSASRQQVLSLQPNPVTFNQYCSQITNPPCPFTLVTYSGTVTLTAAEMSCQQIVFSWSECCRPELANIQNAQAGNIYTEAMVKIGTGFHNSSPAISSLSNPVPLVQSYSKIIYSVASSDPDCDSLSFELVAPLTGPGTPVLYRSNPGQGPGSVIYNPCPRPPYGPFNPQVAITQGLAPQQFSPNYPLPAVGDINWTGPATVPHPGSPTGFIWAATPGFAIDPVTGQLSFIPYIFYPVTMAENRYLVEVKVNEWRKINGSIMQVGSTRRSIVFNVVSSSNDNPGITNITANGHPIRSAEIITLRPGMPLNLQFNADDCQKGYGYRTFLSTDVGNALPGAVFAADTSALPQGSITWSGSLNCSGIKFFQVKVGNHSCGINGFQTHTFGVRVSTTAAVTGLPDILRTASPSLSAYPNPFSHAVKFRFNVSGKANQQIIIYNSLGQLVDRLDVQAGEGQQEVSWENASRQRSGLYIARLMVNGQPIQTVRFTKAN